MNAAENGPDKQEPSSKGVTPATIEIHIHISGPIVIGDETANAMVPVLLQALDTR